MWDGSVSPMQEISSPPTTFLKAEVLDAALAAEVKAAGKKPSLPNKAKQLGIPYNTYWRQVPAAPRRGTATKRFKASPELIAAVKIHFGEKRFFEFFEFCQIEMAAAA